VSEAGDPAIELEALRAQLAEANARVTHLERALQSNRRIGLAAGILMSRHHLTADQAFDRLCEASQRRDVKLRDLAADVVHCGDLTVVPGAGGDGGRQGWWQAGTGSDQSGGADRLRRVARSRGPGTQASTSGGASARVWSMRARASSRVAWAVHPCAALIRATR
jgi:hypothetical protein